MLQDCCIDTPGCVGFAVPHNKHARTVIKTDFNGGDGAASPCHCGEQVDKDIDADLILMRIQQGLCQRCPKADSVITPTKVCSKLSALQPRAHSANRNGLTKWATWNCARSCQGTDLTGVHAEPKTEPAWTNKKTTVEIATGERRRVLRDASLLVGQRELRDSEKEHNIECRFKKYQFVPDKATAPPTPSPSAMFRVETYTELKAALFATVGKATVYLEANISFPVSSAIILQGNVHVRLVGNGFALDGNWLKTPCIPNPHDEGDDTSTFFRLNDGASLWLDGPMTVCRGNSCGASVVTVFNGNTANFKPGSLFRASNVVFDSNYNFRQTYEAGGGQILVTGCTELQLERCVFRNNTANVGGGVVHAVGAAITIDDVLFENNSVVTGDGAGVMYSDNDATLVCHKTSMLQVRNSVFINNTALASQSAGGALRFNGQGGALQQLTACTFQGNKAANVGKGNAIAINKIETPIGTEINLDGCIFKNEGTPQSIQMMSGVKVNF
jgi:hypothetical protein